MESMTFVNLLQVMLLNVFLIHENILFLFYQPKLTNENTLFIYTRNKRKENMTKEHKKSYGYFKNIFKYNLVRMCVYISYICSF